MDHFQGVNGQERFNNELLSELRQIRKLLEHNAQVVEQPKEEKPVQRRGRRKGVVNQ
jgi:hypothetical protein